jgi:hypothetical protein
MTCYDITANIFGDPSHTGDRDPNWPVFGAGVGARAGFCLISVASM